MRKWLCLLLIGVLLLSMSACQEKPTWSVQGPTTGESTPSTQESTNNETTPVTQAPISGELIPVIQGPPSSASNPELAETFIAILQNEKPFYHSCYRHYPNELVEIFLFDLLSEHETNIWKYSYVDMDSDNNEELVIALGNPFDTLILRKEGSSVFCFIFDHREMYQINLDGSFLWNSNAGMTYGCSRFSFSGSQYETAELWRVDNTESGSTAFYIKGEPVSGKEEFDTKSKEWNADGISWIYWGDSP